MEIRERLEDKAPGGEPGVGEIEDFAVDLLVAEEEDVDVDHPRGVALRDCDAAEAELDALRARNEAAGAAAAELGNTPPPEPIKLPANTSQQTRQKTNSKRTP